MPKRTQGRPAKKARARRTTPRAQTTTAEPAAAPTAGTVAASTAAASTAAAAMPSARRPGSSAARRTPVITINYAYLRRDILTLAVLAPTMIVVLIIAFILFH